MLWDGLQPTEVEMAKPFYKRTLLFPRQRVLSVCPRLAELDSLPELDGIGSARLLVRYMNALAFERRGSTARPHRRSRQRRARAAARRRSSRASRARAPPSGPPSRPTSAATSARTCQTPTSGPTSIAQAFSISLRALHALFEDADASVAVLVRNERLARCEEDLRRPNGGSVTDIAFRWGFCDAAHFSRVFKRQLRSDAERGPAGRGRSDRLTRRRLQPPAVRRPRGR